MNLTKKLIAGFALFTSLCPLFAAEDAKPTTDPLAGAFYPPEIVFLAGDRIALTQEQREAIRASMEKVQARSEELHGRLEKETVALSVLAKQGRIEQAAIDAQLDKVLDVEREFKHMHVGLLVSIKNLLTPEQQTMMHEIVKDGGKQLMEEMRKRLTGKVEQVKEAMQKWADAGHDPMAIGKLMEEKVKPLLDGGKPLEAEVQIDRVLEQIKRDTK